VDEQRFGLLAGDSGAGGLSVATDSFTLSTRIHSRMRIPARIVAIPIFTTLKARVLVPKDHASPMATVASLPPSSMIAPMTMLATSATVAPITPITAIASPARRYPDLLR
jgi:hypothetical protein